MDARLKHLWNRYPKFRQLLVVVVLAPMIVDCSGCELYLRDRFTVHVFSKQTKEPVSGVVIKAEYDFVNIFKPKPEYAVTDELGRARFRIPDTESMAFEIGDESFAMNTVIWRNGGWLIGTKSNEYVMWLQRGWNESRPDAKSAPDA